MGIFFKLIRRLQLWVAVYNHRIWLCKMHYLYKHRFVVEPSFSCGNGTEIIFDTTNATLLIQKNVMARKHFFVYCGNNGTLTIGNNVFFNNSCSINCMESITIGNDCQFGENVKMYDHNHAYKNKALPINQQGYVSGAITIGNNCWIGSNVTILRNVQIGNNVVVGAGCVVAKSIPDNTVVVHQQNLHSFSY